MGHILINCFLGLEVPSKNRDQLYANLVPRDKIKACFCSAIFLLDLLATKLVMVAIVKILFDVDF